MKTESPLTIFQAQFYAYSYAEMNDKTNFIYFLNFDNRRDFAIDNDFAGIATSICFQPEPYDATETKGIRRKISVSLIDATLRLEIATRLESVYTPKAYPEFESRSLRKKHVSNHLVTACFFRFRDSRRYLKKSISMPIFAEFGRFLAVFTDLCLRNACASAAQARPK